MLGINTYIAWYCQALGAGPIALSRSSSDSDSWQQSPIDDSVRDTGEPSEG